MSVLKCACGAILEPTGIEEAREDAWLVRFSCGDCVRIMALEATPEEAARLVDRTLWTDEARHRLERMPPYVASLVRPEVEEYARANRRLIISEGLLTEAGHHGVADWEPEAEQRLAKIPAAVRAMAKLELERTAVEKGEPRVTVALMEEVKARYFGLFGKE